MALTHVEDGSVIRFGVFVLEAYVPFNAEMRAEILKTLKQVRLEQRIWIACAHVRR
jgi:hypothetical protein